jgi:Flp pilus assembly protein TadG
VVVVKIQEKTRYRGLATVEAALVFPLLLLLTLGAIEYGWLFLKAQEITNAARNGARVAIRADATTQDVINVIDSLMMAAGMDGSGYAVQIIPGDVSSPAVGDAVNVQVTVPCANIIIIDTPLLPTPVSLGASVAMAKEGP